MIATFSHAEIAELEHATDTAEELTGDHYQLSAFGPRRYLYDVATADGLRDEEVAADAFAQLCRYDARDPSPGDRRRPGRYYRVCLQDTNIMSGVDRAAGAFPLPTLLLYIMTHELIHIVRFDQFQHPFVTDPAARELEEQRVHKITYEILSRRTDGPMAALLDYYRTHRIPRCL